MKDAYAAIVTPPGRSGVAMIRISGPDAAAVGDSIFRFGSWQHAGDAAPDGSVPSASAAGRTVRDLNGYQAAFGYVVDAAGAPIDQAVLLRYRAPHSFTGEDTVEVSVHGGQTVSARTLAACLEAGARAAEPGEFTRNAFLNGKLDLAQAEAVMDLIAATAQRSADAARRQLQGGLSERIRSILDLLCSVLAELEMGIEYPEHEDSAPDFGHISMRLETVEQRLSDLRAGFRQGCILKQGLQVVLTGLPNAGKSSLMNALSGTDRSIVTDIPGTTRDTVEQDLELDGIPVHLIDTAGLRRSGDLVEQLGVERARRALAGADLVIWMVAPSDGSTDQYRSWLEVLPADKPLLMVANKMDLDSFPDFYRELTDRVLPALPLTDAQLSCWRLEHREPFAPCVISAWDGDRLRPVISAISAWYRHCGSAAGDGVILTAERHYEAVSSAADMLARIRTDLPQLPYDILAQSLMAVADRLALIIGDRVSETVIEEIFSRFCVGK